MALGLQSEKLREGKSDSLPLLQDPTSVLPSRGVMKSACPLPRETGWVG